MSELSDRILRRAGRLGLQRVRPAIPSKTLRRASRFVQEPGAANADGVSQSRGKLTIPHYWAVIVHDGRKRVTAKPGRVLVWFRNPAQDPRFPGKSTPARLSDLRSGGASGIVGSRGPGRRRLTRSEYRFWLKQNAKIKDKDKRPMIVAKSSGPVTGDPFFGNEPGEGMAGFLSQVNGIALEEVRKEMAQFIGPMSKKDERVSVAIARL